MATGSPESRRDQRFVETVKLPAVGGERPLSNEERESAEAGSGKTETPSVEQYQMNETKGVADLQALETRLDEITKELSKMEQAQQRHEWVDESRRDMLLKERGPLVGKRFDLAKMLYEQSLRRARQEDEAGVEKYTQQSEELFRRKLENQVVLEVLGTMKDKTRSFATPEARLAFEKDARAQYESLPKEEQSRTPFDEAFRKRVAQQKLDQFKTTTTNSGTRQSLLFQLRVGDETRNEISERYLKFDAARANMNRERNRLLVEAEQSAVSSGARRSERDKSGTNNPPPSSFLGRLKKWAGYK